MAGASPMLIQYMSLKEQYSDCLLMFQVGDFYELFKDDALTVSRELDLTLTAKDCGERVPMCGVPVHAVDEYIRRLIQKGFKVAVCDQTSEASKSVGLVKREVMRVVTAGTVIEASLLNEKENNYLLSICADGNRAGLAFADVSTGELYVYEIKELGETLHDCIAQIQPVEIIHNNEMSAFFQRPLDIGFVSVLPDEDYEAVFSTKILQKYFEQSKIKLLPKKNIPTALRAAGALMRYLAITQKNSLSHMTDILLWSRESNMILDPNTRRNLELTETLRTRGQKGSLLKLLDKTCTSMGARLLRKWIEEPLCDISNIKSRQDAIEAIKNDFISGMELSRLLSKIHDIERLLSRISSGTIMPRDCLMLKASLEVLPDIGAVVYGIIQNTGYECDKLEELHSEIDMLDDLYKFISEAISPDAQNTLKDGGYIAEGYNSELDSLRMASRDGRNWITDLESVEREATGIKNLKIGFNKVFGYYIEVTKSYYDLVPYTYSRKQTLANCERFITEELKNIEDKILGAEDNAIKLELELFMEVRGELTEAIPRLKATAQAIKELDVYNSLAAVAQKNQYVRPKLTTDGVIDIKGGRHPVVEELTFGSFVPNDTLLDNGDNRMMIITGPNMAGKSTYMRQVALIVLLSHIGSFIPADEASISLTDRIFTRVGASDDVSGGQSTFMVEMTETAHILQHVTSKSLILLDEIGRGTSTFDGLSIAWSVVEHICKMIGPKTLFATHYHELSELEGYLPGVVNYRITAKEHGEDVLFLRQVVRGSADESFGIQVARLAGLPQAVISRSMEIMARLHASDISQVRIGQNILDIKKGKKPAKQVHIFEYDAVALAEEIINTDVLSMTPMDALNKIFEWKEKAKKI